MVFSPSKSANKSNNVNELHGIFEKLSTPYKIPQRDSIVTNKFSQSDVISSNKNASDFYEIYSKKFRLDLLHGKEIFNLKNTVWKFSNAAYPTNTLTSMQLLVILIFLKTNL